MSNLLKSKTFKVGGLVIAVAMMLSVGALSADAQTTTTTTTVVASGYTYSGVMKAGMSGPGISTLQAALNEVNVTPTIVVDGKFGPATKAAVMKFQMTHGLVADGIVGPMTGAKLAAATVAVITVPGGFPAGCTSNAGFSTTTGQSCAVSFTLPAGCTSTAGFSPTTGAKCSTGVSSNLPAGCSSTVGFSPTTGARCDSGSSTPSNPSGPLQGGAGSITVNDSSTYASEEVGEDEEDAPVLAFEVEADDESDVDITSVKVEFVESGATSSEDFDDYAESVSVWLNGDMVGSADVDDFTEGDNNIWTKTISLDGAIVRSGETEEFTVAVTALSNLDSGDIDSDLWTVDVVSVRFEDGEGIVTTEDTDGDSLEQTFDFASFASANDSELKVALNDDDADINEAHVINVDDSDNTEDEPILSFTLEAEGDSDLNLQELPVLITVTGAANVDDMITSITLWHAGEQIASESVGTAVGATEVYTFDDLDVDIGAGDTEEFMVKVDLKSTGDVDLDAGDTIMADLTSAEVDAIEAEDESGEDLAAADLTGTADGQASEVRDTGIMVEFVSSTEERTFVADDAGELDQGTFTITFDVTAFDADMRVDFSCEEGTSNGAGADVAGQGVEYNITNPASNSTTCVVTSNNTDTEDTTFTKEVDENTTRRFTLSVTATAITDAYAEVSLESINYGTAVDNTNANYYTFNLGEFKTDAVFLNAF